MILWSAETIGHWLNTKVDHSLAFYFINEVSSFYENICLWHVFQWCHTSNSFCTDERLPQIYNLNALVGYSYTNY